MNQTAILLLFMGLVMGLALGTLIKVIMEKDMMGIMSVSCVLGIAIALFCNILIGNVK